MNQNNSKRLTYQDILRLIPLLPDDVIRTLIASLRFEQEYRKIKNAGGTNENTN